jgi:hypothetical protein
MNTAWQFDFYLNQAADPGDQAVNGLMNRVINAVGAELRRPDEQIYAPTFHGNGHLRFYLMENGVANLNGVTHEALELLLGNVGAQTVQITAVKLSPSVQREGSMIGHGDVHKRPKTLDFQITCSRQPLHQPMDIDDGDVSIVINFDTLTFGRRDYLAFADFANGHLKQSITDLFNAATLLSDSSYDNGIREGVILSNFWNFIGHDGKNGTVPTAAVVTLPVDKTRFDYRVVFLLADAIKRHNEPLFLKISSISFATSDGKFVSNYYGPAYRDACFSDYNLFFEQDYRPGDPYTAALSDGYCPTTVQLRQTLNAMRLNDGNGLPCSADDMTRYEILDKLMLCDLVGGEQTKWEANLKAYVTRACARLMGYDNWRQVINKTDLAVRMNGPGGDVDEIHRMSWNDIESRLRLHLQANDARGVVATNWFVLDAQPQGPFTGLERLHTSVVAAATDLALSFRPVIESGEYQDLADSDITSVLTRYQAARSQLGFYFKIMRRTAANQAFEIPENLTQGRAATRANPHRIAFVVNTSDRGVRNDDGSHWILFYVEVTGVGEASKLYYLDSKAVRLQTRTASADVFAAYNAIMVYLANVHRLQNIAWDALTEVQQQRGNQCGVYAVHWAMQCAAGTTIEDIKNSPIGDAAMRRLREIYWRKAN